MMICSVCHSNRVEMFEEINSKMYWQCFECSAKFLHKSHFLSSEDEYKHYCTHENVIDDPNYRTFLSRLSKPLKHILTSHKIGLDYGCGPGPALSAMLIEDGYEMQNYDPFFYPDKKVLSSTFDFITCSETVEHFYDPFSEFNLLDKMLHPSGVLAIMTNFFQDDLPFKGWYYAQDPTHVVFYSKKTFEKIALQREWICDFPDQNIVLFKKN